MSRKDIGSAAESLLHYFEQNKTFQADEVMAVPAASYTDPEQWRAEIERIYKRVPLMLALSCELPKPGDYKAMQIMDLPIVLVRDKLGFVHALLNVCAHRWTPVAAEGYGNCSRFTCPFHGWTYGLDGKLIAIADSAKFGSIDKSTHSLKALPCEERHGMIFACLTPGEPLDLETYYGSLLEEYEFAGLRDWTFLGRHVVEGPNWKIAMSNFFESYHFASLHPKTVSPLLVSDIAHYAGFGPNMRIGFAHRPIQRLREVPRNTWGDQEGRGCFSFIRFFFPNTTGAVQFDLSSDAVNFDPSKVGVCLFTQTFPGESPDKSRMVLLYARKQPPKDDAERASAEKFMNWNTMDVVSEEDLASGIEIQKALSSRAHDVLLYGRNERGNQYFHEWLNWFLNDDKSVPQPVV